MRVDVNWTEPERAYRGMTAVASFHKSLLLSQEAAVLREFGASPTLPTLLTLYASVFQLGLSHFLVQATFQRVDVDSLRGAIGRRDDLAKVVKRPWVRDHLVEMAKDDRVAQTAAAFVELSDLRDDLQYGPRLRADDGGFVLDSCRNPPDGVAKQVSGYLERADALFDEVVSDLERQRHSLPYFLVHHADFMLDDPAGLGPYYTDAARKGARAYIGVLRRRLYPNAED